MSARASARELGVVFNIRYKIYKKKFFIKFLNNFMAQLGPFFFYSIGGYLVIMGDLTLGALVAVVGAHEKLYSPWKELLNHYQLTWDSQIKFEQVVAQFDPAGLRDEALQSADPTEEVPLTGLLRAINVTLTSRGRPADPGRRRLRRRAAGARRGPGARRQRQGGADAGARQPARPRRGAGPDRRSSRCTRLPEAITGRRMTYVGYPAQIFSGTIADNLFFGLRHRPVRPRELEGAAAELFKRDMLEAKRSGNLPFDSEADWIDYESAGLSGPEEVVPAAVRALAMVRLDRDVYHMGLRGTIDPEAQPEVAAAVLEARRAMRERLAGAALQPPGRGVRRRALQHQRDARREPAVRRAGRRDLRHRASCGASVRPADPRAGRPDGHPGRGRPQGRRHHGRAVRRSAARSRVLPPVQLHRRRRSARVPGADHPRRSEPAGHAQSR